MAIQRFNAVGGYSTGITGTAVIDALGNITGVGATFSGLIQANAGISASGATFSGDIAVNGGDITTTSTSATLFNANATTLDILNTQSSGFTLNIGNATTYSGTKRINIGSNISGGASSEIIIGTASSASKVSILGGITLGGVAPAAVRIAFPSTLEVSANSTFSNFSTFSQLLTANAGISAAGGVTFANAISVDSMKISGPRSGLTGYAPNVAIGGGLVQPVLSSNTTGYGNVGIGFDAIPYNTTGGENTAVGVGALEGNTTGSSNTGVGAYAAQNAFTTSNNTAVGAYSLISAVGSSNTAVGINSLGSIVGDNNVALGSYAGKYRGTGTSSLNSGTGGIYIGHEARGSANATTNQIVIGTKALGLGSNTAVIGATSQTSATIYGTLNVIGGISASGGFTFGSLSGTTFMVFNPTTSCTNGGLWIRDGNLQLAGGFQGSGQGSFYYSPCGEQFLVTGYSTFQNSYNYQSGRSPLRLNGAPTQSVPIFAAYKQTSDGAQLTNTFTTTNMVAGIDQNGALFSTVGVCAAGATFSGLIRANAGISASGATFSGLINANAGINASGATFNGPIYTDSIYDINGILNINNKENTRVAIGDYDQAANSTYIYLRDNISQMHISNPFGVISLGDPGLIDNGNYISYDAANAIFSGNFTSSLEGFQTISADVSILENNRRVTTNARSWFL